MFEPVTAVANGDLDRKLNLAARGEIATLVDTINNMIDTLSTFAEQVTGVARDVGVDGRLGGQADVPGLDSPKLTDDVHGGDDVQVHVDVDVNLHVFGEPLRA